MEEFSEAFERLDISIGIGMLFPAQNDVFFVGLMRYHQGRAEVEVSGRFFIFDRMYYFQSCSCSYTRGVLTVNSGSFTFFIFSDSFPHD